MKPIYVIVTLAFMAASSVSALAQSATPDAAGKTDQNGMAGMGGMAEQPPSLVKAGTSVEIESDTMEILEADKRAIFKGNVDAVRRDQRLKADEMIVTYADVKQSDGSTKTDVQTMDSSGNVIITTRTQTITGDWAKMNVVTNKLEVGGNVKVVQGKTVLTGKHLDVDLKTDRTVMSGGRVRGSFVPK